MGGTHIDAVIIENGNVITVKKKLPIITIYSIYWYLEELLS